jgi:hypothetical protein
MAKRSPGEGKEFMLDYPLGDGPEVSRFLKKHKISQGTEKEDIGQENWSQVIHIVRNRIEEALRTKDEIPVSQIRQHFQDALQLYSGPEYVEGQHGTGRAYRQRTKFRSSDEIDTPKRRRRY